jgi:LPXTG-motif cell wall-anchored protein
MMSNPAILVMTVAGVGIGAVLYVRRKKKAA